MEYLYGQLQHTTFQSKLQALHAGAALSAYRSFLRLGYWSVLYYINIIPISDLCVVPGLMETCILYLSSSRRLKPWRFLHFIRAIPFGAIRCCSAFVYRGQAWLLRRSVGHRINGVAWISHTFVNYQRRGLIEYIHADHWEVPLFVNDVIRGTIGRPCSAEADIQWSLHSVYERLRGGMPRRWEAGYRARCLGASKLCTLVISDNCLSSSSSVWFQKA